MSEHDITKLPKWAQRKIDSLERSVAYYVDLIAGMHSNSQSNVYFEVGVGLGARKAYLPHGQVYFRDDDNVVLGVRVVKSGIKVMPKDMTRVCVYPQSSNVVRVRGVRHDER